MSRRRGQRALDIESIHLSTSDRNQPPETTARTPSDLEAFHEARFQLLTQRAQVDRRVNQPQGHEASQRGNHDHAEAGALGRPVWTVLAASPEWRWLLERSDSPWYPTMRVFRQATDGDWNSVVAAIAAALQDLSAGA